MSGRRLHVVVGVPSSSLVVSTALDQQLEIHRRLDHLEGGPAGSVQGGQRTTTPETMPG